MKFRNPGRTALAAVVLVAQTLLMTSCASNTIDYLYVASNKQNPGQINAYTVDHVSGALHQMKTSPFPAGKNPVAMVSSPNGKNLYVANQDDNTIEQFAIGTDGKLYPNSTFQSKGGSALPVSIAIDPTLNNLYIVYTYQPTYSNLNPGPGDLVIDKLNTDGSFGAQVLNGSIDYWPTGYTLSSSLPTALANALPNSLSVVTAQYISSTTTNVYVASLTASTGTGGGSLFYFTVNSTGVTASGVTNGLGVTGSLLSSVAGDPSGKYLYVTDYTQNLIYPFKLSGTTPVRLTPSTPLSTYNGPSSITIAEYSGISNFFLLVANNTDGRVSVHPIDSTTGVTPVGASEVAASGITGGGPSAIAIDPEQGRFVYTTNFVSNSVSGFLMDKGSGSLLSTQGTPYYSSSQPTAITVVPHGGNPVL